MDDWALAEASRRREDLRLFVARERLSRALRRGRRREGPHPAVHTLWRASCSAARLFARWIVEALVKSKSTIAMR